jgi:hypothetical protein
VIVVTRYDVPGPEQGAFLDDARVALEVLAARPGYVDGSVGRATDDPDSWVLVTQWQNVGSYRRALGSYEVKLHATPLLSRARDEATAFEQLVTAAPSAPAVVHASDLA